MNRILRRRIEVKCRVYDLEEKVGSVGRYLVFKEDVYFGVWVIR